MQSLHFFSHFFCLVSLVIFLCSPFFHSSLSHFFLSLSLSYCGWSFDLFSYSLFSFLLSTFSTPPLSHTPPFCLLSPSVLLIFSLTFPSFASLFLSYSANFCLFLSLQIGFFTCTSHLTCTIRHLPHLRFYLLYHLETMDVGLPLQQWKSASICTMSILPL